MIKNRVLSILFVEVILGVLFGIMGFTMSNGFTTITAFPFEQIGIVLRSMSLHSAFGNFIAFVIYIFICSTPLLYMFITFKKNGVTIKEVLLILLTILLYIVMYLMINTSIIGNLWGSYEVIIIGKSILGITVYSVFFGYIILKFSENLDKMTTDDLYLKLGKLLIVACALFGINIFWIEIAELLNNFNSLTKENTYTQNLTLSYVFLVIQSIIDILPSVISIIVIIKGYELVKELQADIFSENISCIAKNLVKICKKSIGWIICSQIFINVTQLLYIRSIHNHNFKFDIPMFSIIFVLVVLLFSKYFEVAREVKEDSDMII